MAAEKKAIADEKKALAEEWRAFAEEKKKAQQEEKKREIDGRQQKVVSSKKSAKIPEDETVEPEWKYEWYDRMKKRPGDPTETLSAKRARVGAEVH
jgi:hypothetical protein